VLLLSPDPKGLELAFQMGRRAIALDESLSPAHSLLSGIYMSRGQPDQAAIEAQRSIAVDANNALDYMQLANVMNQTGKPAEALVGAEKAIRLDPLNGGHYLYQEGAAYMGLGRYEESIPLLKRDLAYSDSLWDHVDLVRDYVELGQEDAARTEAAEVERRSALNPNSPVGYFALSLVLLVHLAPVGCLCADKRRWQDEQKPNRQISQKFAHSASLHGS